jgi:general stress protein YciG
MTYYLNGQPYESDISASERAAIGGRALVEQRGREHMRAIGRKGGKQTARSRGRAWMRIIARRGWAAMRVQLATSGRLALPVCLACGKRLDPHGDCSDGFGCGLV